jgi:hypothetical protein
MKKNEILKGFILFVIGFVGSALGCRTTESSQPQGMSRQLPAIELTIGESIDRSLFRPVKEKSGIICYYLLAPYRINIFGKQPSEVYVFLDENNNISSIQYTYGMNGPNFTKDDVLRAVSLFDTKATEMGLRLVADTVTLSMAGAGEPNLKNAQSSMKIYDNGGIAGLMMLVAPNRDGIYFDCIVIVTSNLNTAFARLLKNGN